MRVKRNKSFRRILRFFRLEFGVKDPYKVLVDGTFLTVALQQQIQVREQLPKLLGARATPMVTGCVLHELRSLGRRGQGAAFIAQSFYRVKCGHANFINASECIREQIGEDNPRKLLVATQDVQLGRALRQVPGVPLIRLNNSVPFVEDPSTASKGHGEEQLRKKLAPAAWEKPKLPELQQKEAQAIAAASAPRKRKGPKGANPLSCRKKKKRTKEPAPVDAVAGEPPAPQAAQAAQAASAIAEAPKRKRVRSRHMGAGGAQAAREAPEAAQATPQELDRSPAAPPAAPSDEAPEETRSRRKRPRR